MFQNKTDSFTQQLNYNGIDIDSRFKTNTETNSIIFEQDVSNHTNQEKQSAYDTYLDLLSEHDCVILKLADQENTIKLGMEAPDSVEKRKEVASDVAEAIKKAS
jgi:hypothetical protein